MQEGDIVLCHTSGIIGRAIRFAQLHDEQNEWSQYNHVAILDRREGSEWYIIQAEPHGVTNDKTLDTVAPGGCYEVISLPAHVDREQFLDFLRSQVGAHYGFLTILSCAVDMFIWDAVCLRQAGTWICSGLCAAALMYAGFDDAKKWVDIYTTTPAQIGQAISTHT